ncbi:SOS-induced cell division inhibitor SulA [Erwiniaceae bacterium CAU 1747]
MRTYFPKSQSVNSDSAFHIASRVTSASACAAGLVSELIYSENQPGMTQLLLLPLLQQLGKQSRWQLWLTPQQKLSRDWLQRSGLPLDKVMQATHSGPITTVEAMIKALQTGNYSVVLGWFEEDVSESDRSRLLAAANSGQALGLIMRPDRTNFQPVRPLNGLKIHSTLYH